MDVKYIFLSLILNLGLALCFQEDSLPAVNDGIEAAKPVRIMAVGKSGVGKSTIGNFILNGEPNGPFATSSSPESCTREAETQKAAGFEFIDVPGIPDTIADNTKAYYDIMVEEAKKELNAILFVFKYEKIDVPMYENSKLLFQEIYKSKAMKILVINDMTNYGFGPSATDEDYNRIEQEIRESTGLKFTFKIVLTTQNMPQRIGLFKSVLNETESHASPHLRNFDELSQYIDGLTKNKNYEEEVYNQALENIKRIKDEIWWSKLKFGGKTALSVVQIVGKVYTAGSGGIFYQAIDVEYIAKSAQTLLEADTLTMGLAGLDMTVLAALMEYENLSIKQKELVAAEDGLSAKELEKAKKVLKKALRGFSELQEALAPPSAKRETDEL